jgi:hypothetical protein
VPWSTGGGTATADVDYQSANGTVVFAAGNSTPQAFSVVVISDDVFEADETFDVTISPDPKYFQPNASVATVTILNDDGVSRPAGRGAARRGAAAVPRA